MLRHSIRRSVRRLAHALGNQSAALGESSSAGSGQHGQPTAAVVQRQQTPAAAVQPQQQSAAPPPPDYTTVLVEMNRDGCGAAVPAGDASSAASSLSNEQSTSIECLMGRAAPINVDAAAAALP